MHLQKWSDIYLFIYLTFFVNNNKTNDQGKLWNLHVDLILTQEKQIFNPRETNF